MSSLLKKSNPKAQSKGSFIGAWVSDETAEHFTLLSEALGIPKSTIIQECLSEHLSKVKNSKFNLTEALVKRIKSVNTDKDFLEAVLANLHTKGIKAKLIEEITRKYEKTQ